MTKKFFVQIFKYGIVGLSNTLLTAVVIWLMMRCVYDIRNNEDASLTVVFVSNIVGYIVGLINGFIWNRKWTFKSDVSWKKGLIKFLLAFVICYLIQLGFVFILTEYTPIPPYSCQLLGMVVYTGFNFFANKYYTFKS